MSLQLHKKKTLKIFAPVGGIDEFNLAAQQQHKKKTFALTVLAKIAVYDATTLQA